MFSGAAGKKESRNRISALLKNWRQPTLAQAIQALPSARLCLTAEFGMGSGRTTALWPPRNQVLAGCRLSVVCRFQRSPQQPNVKEHCEASSKFGMPTATRHKEPTT